MNHFAKTPKCGTPLKNRIKTKIKCTGWHQLVEKEQKTRIFAGADPGAAAHAML